jgi:hypothetical protein
MREDEVPSRHGGKVFGPDQGDLASRRKAFTGPNRGIKWNIARQSSRSDGRCEVVAERLTPQHDRLVDTPAPRGLAERSAGKREGGATQRTASQWKGSGESRGRETGRPNQVRKG